MGYNVIKRGDIMNDEIRRVMSQLGSRRTAKKAANARANGKLGGRPRKCPECGTSMRRQNVDEQTVWVCGGCESVFELEVKLS